MSIKQLYFAINTLYKGCSQWELRVHEWTKSNISNKINQWTGLMFSKKNSGNTDTDTEKIALSFTTKLSWIDFISYLAFYYNFSAVISQIAPADQSHLTYYRGIIKQSTEKTGL
jgi:hypothetical protein